MKSCFVLANLCIFALYCEFSYADDDECPVEFGPVGCFKDRSRNPALGGLMITDRDRYSKLYSGKDVDWLNYGVYIPDLLCRCAKMAKERGFSHIGLQFYGECWGGRNAEKTFAMYGKSRQCANEYYGDCEDPGEEQCIGRAGANFVYELTAASGSASGSEELRT